MSETNFMEIYAVEGGRRQRPRSSEEMETGKFDEGLVESPKEINT